MALTKFVHNVKDLSDDGGFKFRFQCDRCNDGFESQYIASKANLLKTAIDMFEVFRPVGWRDAGKHVDRGLRGKERDAAYERAVHEASLFFKKCPLCGLWVCPEACWNGRVSLCEGCAPDDREAAVKTSAWLAVDEAVRRVTDRRDTTVALVTCPGCGASCTGGKFCQACGVSLQATRKCAGCRADVEANAAFCGHCGVRQ